MSAKPILYYASPSAPCRAVLLTAAAIELELDLRNVNLIEGDHLTAEFLKMNPQHTIPVLDDNGIIVCDSHVICGYLADKYSNDESLYPKEQIKRMQIDALLYFDCGHLFPRLRFMLEPIIFFGADKIPQEKIEYMQKAYDGLEKCLTDTPYLCDENLTIADLCCIASISTSNVFAPIDVDECPKLSTWLEGMAALPYYQENNQDGVNLLGTIVTEKLEQNKESKQA